MNRIETRIIIAVTSRLAAAKDSQAKTETIEELSENLYQHYQDLVAAGMDEETAYQQAMETLGDVGELLSYLEETERAADPNAGRTAGQTDSQTDGKASFTFDMDGLEDSINDIVGAALSGAREAIGYAKEAMNSAKYAAKDAVRHALDQAEEGSGVFVDLSAGSYRQVDCEAVEAGGVRSLDVKLTNGDIHLCLSEDAAAPVEITGDTEEIQTVLRNDGVICVRQGNTASSSFLFHRGVRSSDIEIRIPRRCFTAISLITVNGDIRIDDGLSCRTLRVQTVSGDLEAEAVQADKINVQTVSGDISFSGEGQDITCTSVSGDLSLNLPEGGGRLKASSKSGDVELKCPEDRGFWLNYQTVSGDFASQLPLAGTMDKRKGKISYLGGGDCEIQLSSVSGDIEVMKK